MKIRILERRDSVYELKPCPFCGGKAKLAYGYGETWAERVCFIFCTKGCCRQYDYTFTSDYDAIKAWNTRTA